MHLKLVARATDLTLHAPVEAIVAQRRRVARQRTLQASSAFAFRVFGAPLVEEDPNPFIQVDEDGASAVYALRDTEPLHDPDFYAHCGLGALYGDDRADAGLLAGLAGWNVPGLIAQ